MVQTKCIWALDSTLHFLGNLIIAFTPLFFFKTEIDIRMIFTINTSTIKIDCIHQEFPTSLWIPKLTKMQTISFNSESFRLPTNLIYVIRKRMRETSNMGRYRTEKLFFVVQKHYFLFRSLPSHLDIEKDWMGEERRHTQAALRDVSSTHTLRCSYTERIASSPYSYGSMNM